MPTSLRMLRFTALTFVAISLAGCQGVGLADGIDLELNFFRLLGPSDALHSPYVAGASFSVYSIHVDPEDEVGWRIGTSDPAVIRVGDTIGDGAAEVFAVAPGDVDLLLLDETGQEVHRAAVEVVQPDRAELLAHGPLLVRRPGLQPESTDTITVLVGGAGTFLVEWYADGDQLRGNGALSATADEGAFAEPRQTFLFEDREWVTFTVDTPGPHEVQLFANGVLTRTLTVVGVAEDAIDRVELHGMDERGAERGDAMVVYAQAYAADDTPIYGVEYAWDVDGLPEEGLGDLYRYTFAPGRVHDLCARHEGLEATATIQSSGGFVDSTNRLGCSVSAVGAGGGALGLPLIAAAVLVWRRRRARRG